MVLFQARDGNLWLSINTTLPVCAILHIQVFFTGPTIFNLHSTRFLKENYPFARSASGAPCISSMNIVVSAEQSGEPGHKEPSIQARGDIWWQVQCAGLRASSRA